MKIGWGAIANGIISDEAKEAFRSVSEIVIQTVGSVDGGLKSGMLDCYESGRCLEIATRKSVYLKEWTSEEVKSISDFINWNIEAEYELWSLYSAMYFLSTCAKYDLGIKFSE